MSDQRQADGSRLSAHEIYELVAASAQEELDRRPRNLAFSGLAAGTTMGLSALGVAATLSILGPGGAASFIASALYPLGFIAVIVGRQQLFTENTLFPVAVVLRQPRQLPILLRLWAVVLVANLVGTALFAWLAVRTAAVRPHIATELVRLGTGAAELDFLTTFWTAVVGGWLIALAGWLVVASARTIGQIVVVWVLTFLISLGHFTHSIAGSAEVLSAWADGQTTFGSYLTWLAAAVLGNVAGGVSIVALLNYGQVHGES